MGPPGLEAGRRDAPSPVPASSGWGANGLRNVGLLSGNKAPSLDHLPRALRQEIQNALGFSSHVAAAFVGGVPVSFCYAASETEALWDISIDTSEPYRRRGLAYDCVNFLIHHMGVHGKTPVWGASDSNLSSRRLAAKLKFEPVDRVVLFTPRAVAKMEGAHDA